MIEQLSILLGGILLGIFISFAVWYARRIAQRRRHAEKEREFLDTWGALLGIARGDLQNKEYRERIRETIDVHNIK